MWPSSREKCSQDTTSGARTFAEEKLRSCPLCPPFKTLLNKGEYSTEHSDLENHVLFLVPALGVSCNSPGQWGLQTRVQALWDFSVWPRMSGRCQIRDYITKEMSRHKPKVKPLSQGVGEGIPEIQEGVKDRVKPMKIMLASVLNKREFRAQTRKFWGRAGVRGRNNLSALGKIHWGTRVAGNVDVFMLQRAHPKLSHPRV